MTKASPKNEPDPPEARPTLTHLTGKRAAVRHPRRIEVVMKGVGRPITGTTVDLSRTGMLAEITIPGLPKGKDADLLTVAARVKLEFAKGLDVKFGGGGLTLRAEVVRIVQMGRTAPVPTIACRFVVPLTPAQCALLGVPLGKPETA